jgi:hypothetical protein
VDGYRGRSPRLGEASVNGMPAKQSDSLLLCGDTEIDRPIPDALQDVLTRERELREGAPEQPGASISTSVRGGR